MSAKPRSLSDTELVKYAAILLDEGSLPVDFQVELVRRLNAYAAADTPRMTDERQLDLFTDK
jgi:hypothetical protein